MEVSGEEDAFCRYGGQGLKLVKVIMSLMAGDTRSLLWWIFLKPRFLLSSGV